MGAVGGIPYLAVESGTKSFVQSFGEALHVELGPMGVNVTVLVVPPTKTAIIDKFGLDPASMPMKPMSVEQCVYEGLHALTRNRSTCLPGRVNRVMKALIPASLARAMMGNMLAKALLARARPATA